MESNPPVNTRKLERTILKPIFKIGKVQIPNNVFLAPMAGVTDKSFRHICCEMGCGLAYTEMISAKSIMYENVKQLLDRSPIEQPWAIQIFGREPETMAQAARRLLALNPDIIDINMGCPAPKIVKNGEGSALMKEPALAAKIITAVATAVDIPVTVKIRKGFSSENPNCTEIAKIAQESGASAICVHGRTREQFYSGCADWDAIAEVKSAVTIPVIANGDITSPETAETVQKHTNCDAIMVARASCGNPWLFAQITKNTPPPNWPEKLQTALRHAQLAIEHKGEHIGALEMRKHLSWYIKGLPSATKLRTMINKTSSYSEMERLLTTALHDDIIPYHF